MSSIAVGRAVEYGRPAPPGGAEGPVSAASRCVSLARSVRVGDGGFLGLALAPRVDVQPGGRVVVGLREAALGGAVAGILGGLLVSLLRSRRSR